VVQSLRLPAPGGPTQLLAAAGGPSSRCLQLLSGAGANTSLGDKARAFLGLLPSILSRVPQLPPRPDRIHHTTVIFSVVATPSLVFSRRCLHRLLSLSRLDLGAVVVCVRVSDIFLVLRAKKEIAGAAVVGCRGIVSIPATRQLTGKKKTTKHRDIAQRPRLPFLPGIALPSRRRSYGFDGCPFRGQDEMRRAQGTRCHQSHCLDVSIRSSAARPGTLAKVVSTHLQYHPRRPLDILPPPALPNHLAGHL